MVAAGQLNIPCILQIREKSGQDLAGKDKVEWVDQEETIWIRLQEPSDSEQAEFGGKTARIQWVARTHWHPTLAVTSRPDITPTQRLISNERTFYVVGAVDPFGDRSELRLRLTEDL